MNNPKKLATCTPSPADANFAALAALFPNAVTETADENGAAVRAIDKDVLTQEINAHVVEEREERYQFTWPDKRKSLLLANAPIAAALRPCREESDDGVPMEKKYADEESDPLRPIYTFIDADENVWLTQKMLGVLYNVDTRTVNYHLKKYSRTTSWKRVQLSEIFG